jgi:nicotinamide phosphoribosyltransferase
MFYTETEYELMFNPNPLLAIDYYKADHRSQYETGTEMVYSNATPRSNKIFAAQWPKHDGKYVAFGMEAVVQHFIHDLFDENFFNQPATKVCDQYKRTIEDSLGEGAITFDHIHALHELGYLPVEIKALPEGYVANMKVPFLTIKNTLPEFFWLVNYLETLLSSVLWKPLTTATIAREYRKIIDNYAEQTGSTGVNELQCHDFSFRGMSGLEDATFAGMGHLTSFNGTDSAVAKQAVEYFYNAPAGTGLSVPATEHSVMCMGKKSNEIDTFKRILDLYPTGIVSIVSDTWDFWKVMTSYTVLLKDQIKAREGKTVFRPDSGDPVKIITGYTEDEVYRRNGVWHCVETNQQLPDYVVKGAVECLYEVFGGTKTEKGYIELDESVGLIYGDSITLQRCEQILQRLKLKGYASSNIVFGIGSFTYQFLTRDTLGIAVKATAGIVDGEFREIFKEPATDDGTKKSATGYLIVQDGKLLQKQETDAGGDLEVIFRDGEIKRHTNLQDIRNAIIRSR